MKLLTMLSIIMIVFTGCAVLTPQETQQERLRLIEAYNEARRRHSPEKVKRAVKNLLVGKWQYVGLEVEEGSITTKMAKPMTEQEMIFLNLSAEQGSNDTTSEQATTPNESEQATPPNAPDSEASQQTSAENTTRLPRIDVTDNKSSQQILGAKAALVASTRQNLTVEFYEDRGSYYYNGSNSGKQVTGQCYVTTKQYGDDPYPFMSFNRRTGMDLVEFLFGSESVKRIAAQKKRERAERIRNMVPLSARFNKTASFAMAKAVGVTVTEDTLYLVLYGDMKLTPKGWMRIGGLRCTFKRVEEE